MLNTHTRRRLKEHGWLEIEKKHSNPYVALNRFRHQAIEAINDLVLLRQKLPVDIMKDVFNDINCETLVDSILNKNFDMNDRVDYARRTQLASMLVKKAANFCIDQYKNRIETNAVLNEPIVSQLLKAISICDEIAFKILLTHFQSEAGQEHLTYLFNYNRITKLYDLSKKLGDTGRLVDFCEQQYGLPFEEVRFFAIEDNSITFEFIDVEGNTVYGKIALDYDNRTADFYLDGKGKVIQHKFVLKIERDNMHLYKRNTSTK